MTGEIERQEGQNDRRNSIVDRMTGGREAFRRMVQSSLCCSFALLATHASALV
jgi:DNA-binding MarR family transcriptional regulator